MRVHKDWSSHYNILIHLVQNTEGPIAELGGGFFSTPLLHWMCQPKKRELHTYDNSPNYVNHLRSFKNDWHTIEEVNWDTFVLSGHYAFILIDQCEDSRARSIEKFKDQADIFVLHDSQPKHDHKYHYSTIYPLFKYVYHHDTIYPHVTVLSNKVDVTHMFDHLR